MEVLINIIFIINTVYMLKISAISKVKNKSILSECKLYLIKTTSTNIITNGNPRNNFQKLINKYKLKFININFSNV